MQVLAFGWSYVSLKNGRHVAAGQGQGHTQFCTLSSSPRMLHTHAGGQGHLRRMVHLDVERGTVTLNAATVPRVRKPGDPSSSAGSSASSSRSSSPAGRAKDGEQAANGGSSAGGGVEGSKGSASSRMSAAQRRLLAQAGVLSWRHFLVVTVADGMVEHAKDVWVEVQVGPMGPLLGVVGGLLFTCVSHEEAPLVMARAVQHGCAFYLGSELGGVYV